MKIMKGVGKFFHAIGRWFESSSAGQNFTECAKYDLAKVSLDLLTEASKDVQNLLEATAEKIQDAIGAVEEKLQADVTASDAKCNPQKLENKQKP